MDYHKDLSVLGINRLRPHGTSLSYDSIESALNRSNDDFQYKKCLNGTWSFYFAKCSYDIPDKHFSLEYDASSWATTPVPSCWQAQGYGTPHYTNSAYPYPIDPPHIPDKNETGIYRREFLIPDTFTNRKTILHFGGVNSAFKVYVNGLKCGYSQGSHMPSEFDITPFVKSGSNLLSVEVYQFNCASYLEDQDYFRFSGIFRDVMIYSVPTNHVTEFYVNSVLSEDLSTGNINIECSCSKQADALKYYLYDNKGTLISEKMLDTDCKATISIDSPEQWTAETPNLYTSVLVMIGSDGMPLDIRSLRTGFKRIDIDKGIFKINGQAVKIKGVNRHDTHYLAGHAVSHQSMLEDVVLMKKNNFNAVRTSHYPPSSYFLDLCDEYGLYIIDEADLEAHGFYYKDPLTDVSDKTEWRPHFVDRAQRMVLRDRSHPCVIMWSLGNETRYGSNHLAMIKEIKKYSSLPIHYEQAGKNPEVDVVSVMYPHVDEVVTQGKKSEDSRPYFLCEYGHAMGNATGNLKEYWDAFYKYPRLMGGCIWEWADHTLLTTDEKGIEFYGYGGDFGDVPNDNNFCMDGLNYPDRKPHTSLIELKKIMEPARITDVNYEKMTFCITNTNSFLSLDYLNCRLELCNSGCVTEESSIDVDFISPGETSMFEIPFDLKADGEYSINFYFTLKSPSIYADYGFEVCKSQIIIGHKASLLDIESTSPKIPEIRKSGRFTTIYGKDFQITFDLLTTEITDWIYMGNSLLDKGFKPDFFRASTDNDKARMRQIWLDMGLDRMSGRTELFNLIEDTDIISVETVRIMSALAQKPLFRVKTLYKIYFNGIIDMNSYFEPLQNDTEYIPRIGLAFKVPLSMQSLKWYGRGPHESYCDRYSSALLGIYEGSVKDQLEPYEYPQESGNKLDTRWISFSDTTSNSLMIISANPISMSALLYSSKELDEKNHRKDLTPDGSICIHLDVAQNAIGNNSCGPEPLEKYRLYPRKAQLNLRLIPYNNKVYCEKELYSTNIL